MAKVLINYFTYAFIYIILIHDVIFNQVELCLFVLDVLLLQATSQWTAHSMIAC